VPDGYISMRSDTYTGYALLRSILRSTSDDDVAQALAYGKRIKLYPLSQAAEPAPTVFADAIDVVFDATIPYDSAFFEALDRVIQREPWLTRDKAMVDTVKAIGIEKDKPLRQTDRPVSCSTTAPRTRTPGWTQSTRRCSRRPSTTARNGRCPRRWR
jgi:hypothetical protein